MREIKTQSAWSESERSRRALGVQFAVQASISRTDKEMAATFSGTNTPLAFSSQHGF
ncbi:hypothetical protein RFM41_20200 [Mesorhizobium sp. VK25A]|uniref:Uncharacterized protein n=1 Tax=Mesorhizobium vachelliae TaxID=3072309 RepID=A0ABU5AB22_9HYPH|nr:MULTISPECIES: hypothetical protein [unclassified Mesorhizobium]MDX8533428.1 hypothetical protein [Mesorhizobium sp. VK25D]MDX8546082.1 hypothetical protein [Mesorhizobium sp. VK25A]